MHSWYAPWTFRSLGWILAAFLLMTVLTFPFTYFFDTMLTKLGFLYSYFWALPQAIIVYYVAFRFRLRWSSTVLLGLQGALGAPVDYYLDWILEKNLLHPLYAALYIPLFLAVGVAADVSLRRLRPDLKPGRSSMFSAVVFTGAVLALWMVATIFFYPYAGIEGSWLGFGYFLIPYALLTGSLGGFLGFCFSRDNGIQRR